MVSIKATAQTSRTQLESSTSAKAVYALMQNLHARKQQLGTLATTPGLAQYAKDQNDDQAYNPVTEYTAVIAALDAVVANVESTLPLATILTGFDANKDFTYQSFGPAATATLRGLLDTLIASID
jgi:hypothetical protein